MKISAIGEFPLKPTDEIPPRPGGTGGSLPPRGSDQELLQKACRLSGRSLSFWAELTSGVDPDSLALLVSRAGLVSTEFSATCEPLQRDQREAVSLFSQIGPRDRNTFLNGLRSLVALRNGKLN